MAPTEQSGDSKNKATENKKAVQKKEDELNADDEKLKTELEDLVTILKGDNQNVYPKALDVLRARIRESTTSMTSVPKPLKFLRTRYPDLIEVHKKIRDEKIQKQCSDVISVLAMTSSAENSRECLKYRLIGSSEPVSSWGHEYVRHLSAEIVEEWIALEKPDVEYADKSHKLLELIKNIVPYHMKHNAEAEACDLLMETEQLDLLPSFVDAESQNRVCLYLTSCVPFAPDESNQKLLEVALNIYMKFDKRIDALRSAIMMNRMDLVDKIFVETNDLIVKKQMAFILARQQIFLELKPATPFLSDLNQLMSNSLLSHYFLALSTELDIMEPKTPEDIYKTHLEPTRYGGQQQVDSARLNLASTFTNGFVNVGFCCDKLMGDDANKWFYKNKDNGMMVAAASMGLIHRWSVDGGLTAIDKYLYTNEESIKAGALLAVGIISNGIHHEIDPAQALLGEYATDHTKPMFQVGSIFGLGLAYANASKRTSVQENVIPQLLKVLTDPKSTPEILGLAGLSLGMICVGTGNSDVFFAMWTLLSEKSDLELKDTNLRMVALGMALLCFGRQQEAETFVETIKVLKQPFGNMAATLVEIAAYAGTGNVLKIQKLLHICSEHYEPPKAEEKKKDNPKKEAEKEKEPKEPTKLDFSSQQAVAVLGIALIAMGEDIGSSMSFRLFGHLLRYGEPVIRRAVPLALGLISVSNPQLNIIETLSKFSHDADPETAYSAIFALGLVGAGTNNARLAAMLRQLAAYHSREQMHLMLVRIAQGMIHMGKGTMTLNPFHSDRQLLNPSALAGLFATCFAFLDSRNTILNKQNYLLYCLVPAIQPRLLITLEPDSEGDKQFKQTNVNVRVGQAVDVVGQAGKPKTITGFQTSTTPVLLAYGERAEMAVDEYTPVTPAMEGFVILQKNKPQEKMLIG